MNNDFAPILIIAIAAIAAVVVFFITRELWCWYFKINEISAHFKSISESLILLTNTKSFDSFSRDFVRKEDALKVLKSEFAKSEHHDDLWSNYFENRYDAEGKFIGFTYTTKDKDGHLFKVLERADCSIEGFVHYHRRSENKDNYQDRFNEMLLEDEVLNKGILDLVLKGEAGSSSLASTIHTSINNLSVHNFINDFKK